MHIKKVVICGAGTMGAGIAAAVARYGYDVVLYDVQSTTLQKAQAQLESIAQKGLAQQKISSGEAHLLRTGVVYTTDMAQCTGHLVIEAIVEKLEAKQDLFRSLADVNAGDTIFCSNTSSISIGKIATALPQPAYMAGLHFFNPAHLMKLVEIVHTPQSHPDMLDALHAFVQHLGKTPVHCKDAPGFIVNRVARPYYLQAMKLVEQAECTDYALIDACMQAAGFKMGPFALMDLIGLDVNYSVSQIVYQELGRPPRLEPSALQAAKVQAGELGQKTGQGFYSYPKNVQS